MNIYDNVLSAIGKTPLVKLQRLVDDSMATVLVKAEYMNPGGAIKDRMAVHMIRCAEERGDLKPGGTIVENTSGNTGFSLAMVAAVRGYRCVFTIPDKMSSEKINAMKAMGAEVIVTPTDVPPESPESYYEVAKRVARETPNSFYVNQYNQPDNIEAHYRSTGPEIWEDTTGSVDCFVASGGTCGTISGVGKYLKEKAKEAGKEVLVVCPDPTGSIFFDEFYKNPPSDPRVYKVEGIGNDHMVDCMKFEFIDRMTQVNDQQAFLTGRRLAREEGLFAGGSAGMNVFTALEMARELGPGKTVVTVLPDSGGRYISKMYNDEWMKDLGFLSLDDRLGTIGDLIKCRPQSVAYAKPDETLAQVATRMSDEGISQMPIARSGGRAEQMIHEADILHSLVSGVCEPSDSVLKAATPLQGIVTSGEPVSKLERIFEENNVAVVVEKDEIVGIVTKIDLVKFLASQN